MLRRYKENVLRQKEYVFLMCKSIENYFFIFNSYNSNSIWYYLRYPMLLKDSCGAA